MYLKSLELLGFKSFAKKTTLLFTTPITAIVGPNGSGKSNIAEAFRFVLGEQSIKSMRGKRTEDLIWNGSPELVRSNRAGVKLIFDNRKKLLNLDFDEAQLERVIYRDASSEYALNGTNVRLRDIVEVLSGAHIGASGHHIISQGEADRILNANVRERREMIEDALGLKVYQWKREESERKLAKTEENMKQVEGLRREIAPHLSFLKKQVEKLEKVTVQKDELRAFYGEYLAREAVYLSTTKTEIAEASKGPRAELAELDRALAEAKKILEGLRGKDEKTKAVLAIEEKRHRLRQERETHLRESGRLEGEIGALKRLVEQENKKASTESAVVPLADLEDIALRGAQGTFEQLLAALSALIARFRTKKDAGSETLTKELALCVGKKKSTDEKLARTDETEIKALEEEKQLRHLIETEKDSSRDAEKELFRIAARQNELRATVALLAAREREREHLENDFKRELTEGVLLVGREILDYEKTEAPPPEADRTKQEERIRQIEKLKIRIEDAGAGGGAEVQKEFGEATEREAFLARELNDLEQGAASLRALIGELEQKLNQEFQEGIGKINTEFQKYFALMFGGGEAKLVVAKKEKRVRQTDADILETTLELEDEEGGIEITVSLPRKKIKGLMMLSGGERALTSIALLFAMSQVKPPPFIILDETDAALDEANSRKYGDMVLNLSKHSQLILITHNRETMSRAGVIYGVTMDRSGVSKLLSIAFEEAAAVAK